MRCNGMQWLMSQPRASGQSKVLGGWWLLGKGRVHKGEDLNLGKIRITNLNYIELYIQTASLFLTTLLLRHFRCWISCRSGGLARWQSLWEPITSRPMRLGKGNGRRPPLGQSWKRHRWGRWKIIEILASKLAPKSGIHGKSWKATFLRTARDHKRDFFTRLVWKSMGTGQG
jgi:hypothetical protein